MMIYNNSFREALGHALLDAGEAFKNIVVIDTDLATSTRTQYFAERFPDRFIQVGISEQDAVGTSAGLAIGGKTPILVSYAMFILRGWEQIRNTISRDNLNVKIVGTHSGLSDYLDGSSHQCLEDVALMRILPNFTVISPSDTISTYSLVIQAIEQYGPVYIRLGRDNAETIYKTEDEVTIGKANTILDGEDFTLVSYGGMLPITLRAANILMKKGYKPRVIDMHTIKPLDKKILYKAAIEASPIIVVEDHSVYGGLGSAVAEYLSNEKPTKVLRIGMDDRFGTGDLTYEGLLEYVGLSPRRITERIVGELNGI